MNLNFLVCSNYIRCDFVCFAPIEGCLQFCIRQLIQQMVAELECGDGCWRTAGVHVSHCATITNMRLQQEVRLPISRAASDSFRIISKIDRSILHSFKGTSIMMKMIKHSVFPLGTSRTAQTARRFSGFKLIAIVSVLDKKLHMIVRMHVDNNGRIVNDVVMQVFQVAGLIA